MRLRQLAVRASVRRCVERGLLLLLPVRSAGPHRPGRTPTVVLFAVALALVACARKPVGPLHPNVIILVMDTARGDRCSVNGYARPTTPFLSKLARTSTVYEDAWSPSSWTGPAHASLFTGLRPENHGFVRYTKFYLDENADTLAEILHRAGYETACLSANPVISAELGLLQGFQQAEVIPERPGQPGSEARTLTARALEFVRSCRKRSRPFFLFVNQMLPHLSYSPPPAIARPFLPEDATEEEVAAGRRFATVGSDYFLQPWRAFSGRQWTILSDLYDAEIAALDAELSRLVTALEDEGGLDDTVLVVVSDHGENLGDHALAAHYASLHRTLLHIPLLIRYLPVFSGGKRVEDVVRLEDVFPTLLTLCALSVPQGLDGRTLTAPTRDRPARAVLGGEESSRLRRDFPGFYYSGQWWRPWRSVYDGRFHLVRRNDGHEELYDVKDDPLERKNLAHRNPDVVRRLRSLLPGTPSGD